MSWRKRVYQALDEPRTAAEKGLSVGLLVLIILSVVVLVAEVQYPKVAQDHRTWFLGLEHCLLVVFGLEYLVRVIVTPRPWRYVLGLAGLIDLAAVLPSLLGLFGLVGFNWTFLRVLRLFRFLRVLKIVQQHRRASPMFSGTILQRVAPYMLAGFVLKLVVIAFERRGWWVDVSDLTEVLAVVGFAIGILLAQKLGVAQERMYAVEDAINTIVGSLRLVRYTSPKRAAAKEFARHLQVFLDTGQAKAELFQSLDDMMAALGDEDNSWFAETIAHNTQFVVHRLETQTPIAYDTFLRRVTLAYGLIIVLFVPGMVGLVSMLLVSYVLGGMYVIIDDMDRPINHDRASLIDADTAPLRDLNRLWDEVLRTMRPPGDDGLESAARHKILMTVPPSSKVPR